MLARLRGHQRRLLYALRSAAEVALRRASRRLRIACIGDASDEAEQTAGHDTERDGAEVLNLHGSLLKGQESSHDGGAAVVGTAAAASGLSCAGGPPNEQAASVAKSIAAGIDFSMVWAVFPERGTRFRRAV